MLSPTPKSGAKVDGDSFVLDLDVYSGPLDALVELVRSKKVDVAAVPVLTIVELFLDWMRTSTEPRLELAADWLVMAATLAYFKSRLLLPISKEEKAQIEAAVEDFMSKLHRVQAIKGLADDLASRRRLGLHWHEPGDPESGKAQGRRLDSTLHTLLVAYVREAKRTLSPASAPVRKPFLVFPVDEAIRALEEFCRRITEWTPLLDVLPAEPAVDTTHARSRVASTYVASLELAKRGVVEVAQSGDYISIRPRTAA